MSQGILVNVFEHSHQYFSLGIRLYFGTIPGKGEPRSVAGAGDGKYNNLFPKHEREVGVR